MCQVLADKTKAYSRREQRDYAGLCLPELVGRIVRASDRLALGELHDRRTLFLLENGQRVLFAQFVDALYGAAVARSWAGCEQWVLDRAYDLTVDKFSHLPDPDPAAPTGGSDCRHYFRAFLVKMGGSTRFVSRRNHAEQEILAAMALQRLVTKHFKLSYWEARRACYRVRSRYVWSVAGGKVCIWMPAYLHHGQRRAWLEANVDGPDPSQPDEQHRIQRIVDERLGVPRHWSLDEEALPAIADAEDAQTATTPTEEEIGALGLAQAVANEKAENIRVQRQAIQALGRERLKQLVLRVFDQLLEGEYRDGEIAAAFNLSKATFSRFAGSRWQTSSSKLPDLWMNVASRASGVPEPRSFSDRTMAVRRSCRRSVPGCAGVWGGNGSWSGAACVSISTRSNTYARA